MDVEGSEAWLSRIGTSVLMSTLAAYKTSCRQPLSDSSRPDEQSSRTVSMRSCASSHAAAAERASGDCAPPSRERTAPAPRKSSSAGRSEPSGHRSPHAITMMGALCCCAHPATASALRRQAATTVEPASWANAAHVEPLGEGSTTASPRIRRKRLIGESDGPSAALLSASSAPTVRAKSALSRRRATETGTRARHDSSRPRRPW